MLLFRILNVFTRFHQVHTQDARKEVQVACWCIFLYGQEEVSHGFLPEQNRSSKNLMPVLIAGRSQRCARQTGLQSNPGGTNHVKK